MSARGAVLIGVKLSLHPVLVLLLLPLFGTFSATWIGTAVLMAALPPALTAFVFARQYGHLDRAGVERGAVRHGRIGRDADRRDVAGEGGRLAAAAHLVAA